MEHFQVTKTSRGFHVEGFPEAVKVIKITGSKSKRLADLALHQADLDFSLECLTAINQVQDPPILRRALWESAIVHYTKCFGQSEARFSLDSRKVYKGDPGASEPFGYFKSLRNRHLIHDENSYAQCLPGAVLNNRSLNPKIAKIVCFSVIGDTLGQENFSNLHLLVTRAREWVVAQFDQLCEILTDELEREPYDDLLRRDAITYAAPGADDIHGSRPAI